MCLNGGVAMRYQTSGSIAAILLILAGVQAQHSVTLSSQSLCAVTGSTVKISCKYTTPDSSRVREREWYQLQSSDGEERVLSKDPQYSARVSVRTELTDCGLTVRNVRRRDSGVYYFRFRTSSGDWISASSGVKLIVTDFQVKIDHEAAGKRRIKVTCSSNCSLNENLHYYWYRNGRRKGWSRGASIWLDSTSPSDAGSYSCKLSGTWQRSPPVCVAADSNKNNCWKITYSSHSVCGLRGSSVDLSCSYEHPGTQTVTKSVWFIKERAGAEPVDVREDEEYQGRVQYRQSFQNDCSMKITRLRERDAQTYRFRFYTDGGEYTGEPGVTLSVTDLKMTVSDTDSGGKDLMCSSSCTLPNNPTYIWYKNGQPVSDQTSNELHLHIRAVDAGSYSCAVRGYEELCSPAVCVPDQNSCWNVSYSTQTICALTGSSVDIHSYYTFSGQQSDPQPAWYIRFAPQDKELTAADGRVEFFSDRANMNILRLKHLTESDSSEYLLRLKAPYWNRTHSSAGVSLSVTGLQVKVEPVPVTVSEEPTVTLECSSTCTLSNNPTYIWYKNGQHVIHCKSVSCSVDVVSGEVSYTCAVEGHESLLSPPVYSPKNTRAVMVSSGEVVEGESVTLSCSSDSNPPVLIYSWFKQRAASDAPLTTGQNYTITNISSQHSGLYYCTAQNQLGQHSSTPTRLDVLCT
uniref:Ig-like domain-containing protein n=1 Tax=Pygocentrus nattereri TaxID=42514 RepID=A0A3B4DQ37_PYGNA